MNNIEATLRAVELIREHDHKTFLRRIQLFLMIAYSPGSSCVQLRKRLNTSQSNFSRDINHLQQVDYRGRPGLGWVYVTDDPNVRCGQLAHLTRSGIAMAKKIAALLDD